MTPNERVNSGGGGGGESYIQPETSLFSHFFSNNSNVIEYLGSLSGGEENNVTRKIFVASFDKTPTKHFI